VTDRALNCVSNKVLVMLSQHLAVDIATALLDLVPELHTFKPGGVPGLCVDCGKKPDEGDHLRRSIPSGELPE
jgi:hypothetical protein